MEETGVRTNIEGDAEKDNDDKDNAFAEHKFATKHRRILYELYFAHRTAETTTWSPSHSKQP